MHREDCQGYEGDNVPDSFTGFLATYDDGSFEIERENYHSEKLHRPMATSWPEIDRTRLVRLDLYWRGKKMASVSKNEHPHMTADDWFFSQTGYMDIQRNSVRVISRNIGYKGDDGLLYITSVYEANGATKGSVRA